MKLLCVLIVLTCVPLALARNGAAYPKEKVAEFLVEKLAIGVLEQTASGIYVCVNAQGQNARNGHMRPPSSQKPNPRLLE